MPHLPLPVHVRESACIFGSLAHQHRHQAALSVTAVLSNSVDGRQRAEKFLSVVDLAW